MGLTERHWFENEDTPENYEWALEDAVMLKKTEYISKKEAVSRISDLLMVQLKGKRLPTWNEVYHAIND